MVIVLTHVCSLPDWQEDDNSNWKRALDELSTSLKNTVKEALNVDAPLVMIENEYEEHELQMSHDFQQSFLPDDKLQPRNLFIEITDLLRSNGDNLGLMAMKHFFAKSLTISKNVTLGHNVEAKIAKKDPLNPKEMKFKSMLEENVKETSELHSMVDDYISRNAENLKVRSR